MRTTGLTILVMGMVLASTQALAAAVSPQCCACVGPPRIVSNGDSATQAIFCKEALDADQVTGIEIQCSILNGSPTCVPVDAPCAVLDGAGGCLHDDLASAGQVSPEVDCKAFLLEEFEIACPTRQAAPLFGTRALAGLAFGLAGLGAWAVRRRSSARLPG